jgi:hypothetical protein
MRGYQARYTPFLVALDGAGVVHSVGLACSRERVEQFLARAEGRRRARSVSARGIAGLINTMLIRRIGMDSFIERRLGRDTNVFMPDYTGFFEYDPSSDPISEIDFYDGFGGSSGLEGAIVRLDGEYRCTQAEIERIQRQQRRVWRRRTPRRRPSRMEISCP